MSLVFRPRVYNTLRLHCRLNETEFEFGCLPLLIQRKYSGAGSSLCTYKLIL